MVDFRTLRNRERNKRRKGQEEAEALERYEEAEALHRKQDSCAHWYCEVTEWYWSGTPRVMRCCDCGLTREFDEV